MDIVPISQELENLEKIIEDGLQSFVAVGNALMAIKEGKKYRERGFKTFEAYCKERFGFAKSHAYRNIQAAGVTKILSPIGDEKLNEAQARELAPLLTDPDQLQEAWRMVQEKYGQTVTAVEIKNVVRLLKNEQTIIDPDDVSFEHITPESKPPNGRQTYHDLYRLEMEVLPAKLKNLDKEFPSELVARITDDPKEYREWINQLKTAKSRLTKMISNLEFHLKESQ